MIEESLGVILLVWAATYLTVAVTFPRLRAWKPDWQMRAELGSAIPGLMMLIMLSSLVIPGPEFVYEQEVIRTWA